MWRGEWQASHDDDYYDNNNSGNWYNVQLKRNGARWSRSSESAERQKSVSGRIFESETNREGYIRTHEYVRIRIQTKYMCHARTDTHTETIYIYI